MSHVLVSAPGSKTTHQAMADRPDTACHRIIPDHWRIGYPTTAAPTCRACLRALTLTSEINDHDESSDISNDSRSLGQAMAEAVGAVPRGISPYPNPPDPTTAAPLELQRDLTAQYHASRGTPAVHAPCVTPDGTGVMMEHYGPNSVIVRLSDGSGAFSVYSPEEVRRPSPLLDMPALKQYHPVRRVNTRNSSFVNGFHERR